MTSPSDTPPHISAFIARTHEILRASTPNFDWSAISKEGQAIGCISAAEADAMKIRSKMPVWLTEGLSKFQTSTVSEDPTPAIEMMDTHSFEIAPPARQVCQTNMLQHHRTRSMTAEPMIAIQGGQSRHYLRNFSKVSWSDRGVYKKISDTAGVNLLGYLEEAEPVALRGNCFNAVVEGSVVYTHWLLDTLPRLLFWVDQGHDLRDFDYFLFAGITTKFHRQTLELLGIPDDKVITRARHGSLFSADHFTTVSAPRTRFASHPDLYARVRDLFLGNRTRKDRTRRVYISRGKAGRRRVTNEQDLEPVFKHYGIEVLHLEDYSISETAAIINAASHIIAPHGAGLANLVFAGAGAKVLELYSAHLSHEYWIISHQQGLEYHVFEAHGPDGQVVDDAARDAMPFFERNGTDIEIPLEPFKAYLRDHFFT